MKERSTRRFFYAIVPLLSVSAAMIFLLAQASNATNAALPKPLTIAAAAVFRPTYAQSDAPAQATMTDATAPLPSSAAGSKTTTAKARVSPFVQAPGRSVLVTAEGLAPNANATVTVKNVVATVETQNADGTATKTFADSIVAGYTHTTRDGRLSFALGVPADDVTIIERWMQNSTKTGQQEVIKTVTTSYRFQGTVKVVVSDQQGNSAGSELTVLRLVTSSPFLFLGK